MASTEFVINSSSIINDTVSPVAEFPLFIITVLVACIVLFIIVMFLITITCVIILVANYALSKEI